MHTGRLFAPSGESPSSRTAPRTFAAAQIGPQDYTYHFVVKVFKIWMASPGVFAYGLVPQLRTLAVHVAERFGIWRMLSVATLRHQDTEPAWLG